MKGNKLIVIAEDSPTQAARLQFILEDYGFTVLHGKNGSEALNIIRENKPDLVISDITMPIMDGYQLTKNVKNDPVLNRIPIIMLTTLSSLGNILKGLENGADNYILKPFEEKNLISKIESVLKNGNEGIVKFSGDNLLVAHEGLSYKIDSKSTKIVDFLITTYENVLKRNQAAEKSKRELRVLNESLEEKVSERTAKLFKEVTERKQYQYELEESEKKYRLLFDNGPDGISQIDNKGNIVHSNKRESELIGYEKEFIVGKHFATFLNKESVGNFKEYFDILQKEGYLETEMWLVRNDGVEFPVWRKFSAIYENGGFNGAIVHTRDITDRKQAEEKLLYSEQRFCQVTEHSKEWIWEVNTDGLYTFSSKVLENTLGFKPEEIIGKKHFYDFFHPEDKEELKKGALQAFKQKQPFYEFINRNVNKNGETIWLSTSGVPMLDREGNLIGYRGTAFNITERKNAEEELKEAYLKATESDRLKSAFLATMSHELRTPLNAILGFSDLISEDLSGEETVKFAKIVNSSGKHLLTIVDDLFDIALIESGVIKIQKNEENLYSILKNVHDIITSLQQKMGKLNIDLKMIIPADSKDFILQTDSAKLKQILINILKNAVKFTHKGHINYGYSITMGHKTSELEFFVKDTGIGIPEKKREFIFDAFRQADDSHTRIYGGTGIGLSIARKLTELFGGKIWFETEPGKGSTFYFTIPFVEAEKVTKPIIKEIEKNDDLLLKKILIVEDVYISYEYLRIVLERLGLKTIWAQNGKDAIKYCNENQGIDLVLMDINLPDINGYEATVEIKRTRPGLPVIAQTAKALAGDREKSIDAGCDDYITKPIKQKLLIRMIKEQFKQ